MRTLSKVTASLAALPSAALFAQAGIQSLHRPFAALLCAMELAACLALAILPWKNPDIWLGRLSGNIRTLVRQSVFSALVVTGMVAAVLLIEACLQVAEDSSVWLLVALFWAASVSSWTTALRWR